MKNRYLIEAISYLGMVQFSEQKLNNDLKQRAYDKWEQSKTLPRKAKKLMRKDALLDLSFSEWNSF